MTFMLERIVGQRPTIAATQLLVIGPRGADGDLTIAALASGAQVLSRLFVQDGVLATPAITRAAGSQPSGLYFDSLGGIVFVAAGSERLRVPSSGDQMIRITSDVGTARIQLFADNLTTAKAGNIALDSAGNLQVANTTSGGLFLDSFNGTVTVRGVAQATMLVASAASVRPGSDNATSLGAPANRWSTVFAGSGTINTSDETAKAWRGGMDAAELAAALEITRELGFFQWHDAIATKGASAARIHFGVRAQSVWEIMARHGLVDPLQDGRPGHTPYAFLCFDEWGDQWEECPGAGDDGERREPQRSTVAGARFGVRHDQLALFLIAALASRIGTL